MMCVCVCVHVSIFSPDLPGGILMGITLPSSKVIEAGIS